MRTILQFISLLALIALTLPSVIYLAGKVELDRVKWLMLLATIVWFVTATGWMWKDNGTESQEAGYIEN
jgi:branched-subunit amino acid transport protein